MTANEGDKEMEIVEVNTKEKQGGVRVMKDDN